MSIETRLSQITARHRELMSLMAQPDNSPDDYMNYAREASDLEPIVEKITAFQDAKSEMKDLETLMSDPDMKDMASTEFYALKEKLPTLEKDVQLALLPRDKVDDASAILEIRAGTGGDEAAIFVGDLWTMYKGFASTKNWKVEVIDATESSVGGFKEITAEITGKGVYGMLKFESGVHRVQRVPETESQGRVHTSASTVAVLPEAEAVDIVIRPEDLRIDTFRASGKGGQHVNTTDSAVRVTHIPTGVAVAVQDGRSQHKNKDKAMSMLKSHLYEAEREKLASERAGDRKSQIGSGDRSERIRTYNYPQGRVTDHRINITLYDLDNIITGAKLADVIDPLHAADQADKLADIS